MSISKLRSTDLGTLWTPFDVPPVTLVGANNEEMDNPAGFRNSWTFFAGTGTANNGAITAEDNAPATNPNWNIDTTVRGALVLQPVDNSWFGMYRAHALTSTDDATFIAKVSLLYANDTDDRLSIGFSKNTPAAENPDDSIVLQLRRKLAWETGSTTNTTMEVRSYRMNSSSAGGEVDTMWPAATAYLAITQRSGALWAWESIDGIGWTKFAGYGGGNNIVSNVNYVWVTVRHNNHANSPGPVGVIHYMRFADTAGGSGGRNLYDLGQGL